MKITQINLNNPTAEIHQMGTPASTIEAAKTRLMQHLQDKYPNLTPDQLTLVFCLSQTWNNSALGCPEEGKYYLQVITPGYELTFKIGDEYYRVHTNTNGTMVAIPKNQNLSPQALRDLL